MKQNNVIEHEIEAVNRSPMEISQQSIETKIHLQRTAAYVDFIDTVKEISPEAKENTPARIADMWDELLVGYKTDPQEILSHTFEADHHEMVIERDIEFYSMCEHHFMPFFGKAYIAYIPTDKVVGLSKLPRLVDCFAKRFQIQERLTSQIADALMTYLKPQGCMVVMQARHFCVMMRGVEKQNADTVTSAVRGAFQNPSTRDECLRLLGKL